MADRRLIFLDTHAVVWLYQGKKVFSNEARALMTDNDMRISPIVRFELMMLFEKQKIEHPFLILNSLKKDFYFSEDRIDFSQLVSSAMKYNFTRDPFDRMIVAHAVLRNSNLITKDKMILDNFKSAIW